MITINLLLFFISVEALQVFASVVTWFGFFSSFTLHTADDE